MTTTLPLTRGRRIALAAGVPVTVAVIGWFALTAVSWAGQGSYGVHLSVPVRGHAATLGVDSGDVTLRAAAPGAPARVEVTGIARYSLVKPGVSARSTPSGVQVKSHCSVLSLAWSCGFDFRVTAPAGLVTQVSTGSGSLSARGMAGPLVLATGSGDIRADSVTGNVRVRAGSGEITGSAVSGGVLTVSSQSGDITVTGLASRRVAVDGDSGEITLIFTAVPDSVRVRDQSGDVKLVLPHGRTAYRVSAHTASGQTVVGVPVDTGSGHVITVSADSGDITVSN